MTQKEKILKLLEERKYKGLSSFEGYRMFVPRIAARIVDLKEDGAEIRTRPDANNRGVIYYLAKYEKMQPELF